MVQVIASQMEQSAEPESLAGLGNMPKLRVKSKSQG